MKLIFPRISEDGVNWWRTIIIFAVSLWMLKFGIKYNGEAGVDRSELQTITGTVEFAHKDSVKKYSRRSSRARMTYHVVFGVRGEVGTLTFKYSHDDLKFPRILAGARKQESISVSYRPVNTYGYGPLEPLEIVMGAEGVLTLEESKDARGDYAFFLIFVALAFMAGGAYWAYREHKAARPSSDGMRFDD